MQLQSQIINMVKLKDEGHEVKTFCTKRKVLSKGDTHVTYESPITNHS